MGIVRNFINVIGVAPEYELPNKINGQIVQYSEIETILIPNDKPEVKSIYEIMVDVKVKSIRTINAPLGKTIVVDGEKKYKIIYTENGDSEKANILYLSTPYNTFFELSKDNVDIDINNIKVYILDAYFDLISPRKIYCHSVYLLDANYSCENLKNEFDKNVNVSSFKENIIFESNENIKIELNEEFDYDKKILSEISMSTDECGEDVINELIDIDAEYL